MPTKSQRKVLVSYFHPHKDNPIGGNPLKEFMATCGVIVLCSVATCSAQIAPPNEAGVSMGHLHLIVRNVDAEEKVWMLAGGKSLVVDGTEVMKFPGELIFLTPGSPSGGNKGAVLDHV